MIILSNACSSTKEHTKFRFAKTEFEIQKPTLLRTDGVYIDTFIGFGGIKYYGFYRFYTNGRCFLSNLIKGMPCTDTLIRTSKNLGQRTFYRNDGNKITYEVWGGYYTGYCYDYAVVDDSFFTDLSYRPRRSFAAKQAIPPKKLKFRKMNFSDKPDW